MPTWNDILEEIAAASRDDGPANACDVVRRKYLARLYDLTKRNVIAYYSGWLQKPELEKAGLPGFELNDADKNGFIAMMSPMSLTEPRV